MKSGVLGLFEGYGVEIEYMIVDRESLQVRGLADEVLRAVSGGYASEVEVGDLAWSNELVLHVVELKTNGPAARVEGLDRSFSESVGRIARILGEHNARLMPTAMHPWMDPEHETRLWPHENGRIYSTFDRIFDCRGHGWANVQSIHLNLPFRDDREFGHLHAAVRMVLPILPALSASSPIVAGHPTGRMDNRMAFYRKNCRRVASVTGRVIPERVFTIAAYQELILETIYRDMARLDPEGILRHEWINARGAIARFDRNTIEIRVLDVQESPQADLAVAGVVAAVVRAFVEERTVRYESQTEWSEKELEAILLSSIRHGDQAVITNEAYLRHMGYKDKGPTTALDLWRHLIQRFVEGTDLERGSTAALDCFLKHGCLASRILRSLGRDPKPPALVETYRALCDCLEENRVFLS
jgi:carboxylate-amine ligase